MYKFYAYAMRKTFKSKSTWIVLVISFALTFYLCGILPYSIISTSKGPAAKDSPYLLAASIGYYSVTLIYVITIALFSGFKGANVFKDEVEDGSLLIMISKPISRNRLILSKWLAYITSIFLFIVIIVIGHNLGLVIGDKGNILKADKVIISICTEILVCIVLAAILSSISLISSTFLSSGLTIGITVGFGFIVPITALVQTFTYKNPNSLTTSDLKKTFGISDDSIKNFVITGKLEEPSIGDQYYKRFFSSPSDFANWLEDQTIDLPMVSLYNVFDTETIDRLETQVLLAKDEKIATLRSNGADDFLKTPEFKSIYENIKMELGSIYYTDKTAGTMYNKLVFIDFNYQTSIIGSITLDAIGFTKEIDKLLSLTSLNGDIGRLGPLLKKTKTDKITYRISSKSLSSIASNAIAFEKVKETKPNIPNFFSEDGFMRSFKYFTEQVPQTIAAITDPSYAPIYSNIKDNEYVDFLDKYWVMIVYLLVALTLVPTSFLILRKQNFR